MSAVVLDRKREDLFREISNVLRKWPDLERRIFDQAHYHGQSPESISRSFKMDVEKVSSILKRCDHELHTSLREFRKGGIGKAPLIPATPSCQTACNQ
jgi:DNA-directed RNA polymerase specialized sigma24 family protein